MSGGWGGVVMCIGDVSIYNVPIQRYIFHMDRF